MSDTEKIIHENRKKANAEELEKERERIRALNTENAIYFNFSYTALKLLGKNLYNSPLSAVAELVANGIDAKANNIYVYIDMSDKEHSTIEIIDDGSGMDYEDLAEKYVWIGRNKREDSLEDKDIMMGRKGIGKLAALYLSNKYYIFSKKNNEESRWWLNVSAYRDSDFPKLDKIGLSKEIKCNAVWTKNTQGTAIILENVDLRRTGSKRIEGLKRNLSDYYLIDAIQTKIWVAVVTKKGQGITFEPVEKHVAYKNFYAVFDNSGYNVKNKISDEICFTWLSEFPHIANLPRPTIVLNPENYTTKGTAKFQKEDGTFVEKAYTLSGWIAIHATIESKDALDENFLRNDIYQPNRLRLYVRKKLAVANYFDLNKSTQAMSNYIEGEISFDILDDDDLPDIATSSRQDFLDDERIEKLIEVVTPIVNTLFKLRIAIGNEIRKENKDYQAELLEVEKRKQEEADKARALAEQAQLDAEKKAREESEKAKRLQAQNNTIFNTITEDQEAFTAKTHLVKTNALTIRNSVATLARKIKIEEHKELGAISIATDKILSALKYSVLAKFKIEDEYIVADLFAFCKEYIDTVLRKQYFAMNIKTEINGEYQIRFNPQYISLILDNLLSNSEKGQAKDITLYMYINGTEAVIEIEDNGNGFGDIDLSRIFEFGFSNTGGTGIGLYNIKRAVERMKGSITASKNQYDGATFTIRF